jgi:hypothetical protein
LPPVLAYLLVFKVELVVVYSVAMIFDNFSYMKLILYKHLAQRRAKPSESLVCSPIRVRSGALSSPNHCNELLS